MNVIGGAKVIAGLACDPFSNRIWPFWSELEIPIPAAACPWEMFDRSRKMDSFRSHIRKMSGLPVAAGGTAPFSPVRLP
jgi:hypothetical protein